jgi:hypothetical protein
MSIFLFSQKRSQLYENRDHMKKKIIFGFSAFVGTNMADVLGAIQSNLRQKSQPLVVHTAVQNKIACIANQIKRNNEPVIHLIENISSVQEIRYLRTEFQSEVIEFVGIEVFWQQCLEYLKSTGIVMNNRDPLLWRKRNEATPYRQGIIDCHKEIQASSAVNMVFHCDSGSFFQATGEISDMILLRLVT